MARTTTLLLAAALAATGAACADGTGPQPTTADLTPAFTSSPAGFDATTSSFSASTSGGAPGDTSHGYRPEGDHRGGRGHEHGRGPNGLPPGLDFMGGGFGHDFLGGPPDGHGRPFDFGGPSGSCTYAGGVLTCTEPAHNGLTVVRTLTFTTAAGVAQQAADSTTNTIVTHTQVSGTTVRRDSVTAVVSHVSDLTVSGLAKGSTQRTAAGTSAGTENLSGKDSAGVAFTAVRTIGDTIAGIVVPVQSGRPSYPTAGSVTRSMRAVLTYPGKTPTTSTRREVVTYDGSATAKLVITRDGVTKTCSLPLPHGHPTCT